MKALKFTGIALLLTAATAYAVDGVVLKYVFKKDSVTKMRMKGTFDLQGTEVSVTMLNQSKVKEIAEDGTVTTEDGVIEGKAVVQGTEIPIEGQPAMVIVLKPNGEIKEIRGDNIDEKTYRMQNLMSFIPPTDAVKVGSTWDRTIAANKDTKAVGVKSTYKIVGEEKIDGDDAFKIEFKTAETEGDTPASSEGTVWISKADCGLIKSVSKWTNVPVPAAPVALSGSMTTERVK